MRVPPRGAHLVGRAIPEVRKTQKARDALPPAQKLPPGIKKPHCPPTTTCKFPAPPPLPAATCQAILHTQTKTPTSSHTCHKTTSADGDRRTNTLSPPLPTYIPCTPLPRNTLEIELTHTEKHTLQKTHVVPDKGLQSKKGTKHLHPLPTCPLLSYPAPHTLYTTSHTPLTKSTKHTPLHTHTLCLPFPPN